MELPTFFGADDVKGGGSKVRGGFIYSSSSCSWTLRKKGAGNGGLSLHTVSDFNQDQTFFRCDGGPSEVMAVYMLHNEKKSYNNRGYKMVVIAGSIVK